MLTEDARMTMPPLPSWYSGRGKIAPFLRGWALSAAKRWHLVPSSANAQPALAGYVWDDEAGAFVAHEITVLTLRGSEIEEVTAFLTPAAFAGFGLPDRVPG
jgi:RNA polymerase sigma-70 factor (ECF subfamily)